MQDYLGRSATEFGLYFTLFPIGSTMRANLFRYTDLNDPWLKQFRDAPQDTLYALWPGLKKLMGDFTVTDFIPIRPVDLYDTVGYRQDGIVLVGDAFATACPACLIVASDFSGVTCDIRISSIVSDPVTC